MYMSTRSSFLIIGELSPLRGEHTYFSIRMKVNLTLRANFDPLEGRVEKRTSDNRRNFGGTTEVHRITT
jgi:hypothetical protein